MKDVDDEEADLCHEPPPWNRGGHTDHTSPEPKFYDKKDTTTEKSTTYLCTPRGRRVCIRVIS